MPISRPLLIVLLGAVVALAAFTAMRSLGSSGAEQAPPAPGTSAAVPPAAPGPPGSRPARSGTPAAPRAARRRRDPAGRDLPLRVVRALADRRVIVLFFSQRRGSDDGATRRAVRAVRSRGAVVVTAPIDHLARYAKIVGGLGISQAPATVIVDRRREARLVEGFQDTASLRQHVVDARR